MQSNRLGCEVQSLEAKLEASRDEIGAMRMSLDEARSNSDRLHRESELVVANVNKWVQEQKSVILHNKSLHLSLKRQSQLCFVSVENCSFQLQDDEMKIMHDLYSSSFLFNAITDRLNC